MTKSSGIVDDLQKIIPSYISNDDVIFFCIGTDRSTGDCIAPMIGSKLKELGYSNVMGTLENPIHAKNLEHVIKTIPKNKLVIAIDACLGRDDNVGVVHVSEGNILAGRGVGRNLPPVGDYKITPIINTYNALDSLNYLSLQSTRLSFVMRLANDIVTGITNRFPLHINNNALNQLVLSYIG
jgi:putative sporulation protein YyaC